MNSTKLALLGGAMCVAMTALSAFGEGDYMTPTYPPGDLRARMKTLNEIEPREAITQLPYPVITNSGAYYLTKSLSGASGYDGIVIDADDVRLDLNGFALNGTAGSLNGINIVGQSHHNITIRNGVVRSWGQCGVSAGGANESILENVTAFTNTGDGLVIGENSVVRNCGGFKNNGNGLVVARDGTVLDCKMRDNGQYGVNAGLSCRISDCSVGRNSQGGITVANYCTVKNCTSVENTGSGASGIKVMSQCRISGNTCGNNGFAGIEVLGLNNRIEDNSVVNNMMGIYVQDSGHGNLIICNSSAGNISQDFRSSPTSGGGDFFGKIVLTNDMMNGGSGFTNMNPWSNFKL